MFVDDSGRRARAVCAAGVAIALLFGLWLGGLTLGMVGTAGFATPRLSPIARLARADVLAERVELVRHEHVDADEHAERGECPPVARVAHGPRTSAVTVRSLSAAGRPTRACPPGAGPGRGPRLT